MFMNLQKEKFYSCLKRLPISICGVTLGLSAVGNLLYAYSFVLHWLYLIIAAVLWFLLLAKLFFCWTEAKQEFQNPMTFSVFEAYFMTMLQFSAALATYCFSFAFSIWILANIMNVILILCFSWRYLRNFELKNVYTSWNVLYGGNMLAAVVAPVFQTEPVAQYIFWIDFLLFLPWYPISVYRYWKLPVSSSVKPSICILAAPFNLTLAGYLTITAQPNLWLVLLFAGIAQFAYAFVLIRLPGILKISFSASYGALTFPFVIPAVALQKLITYFSDSGFVVPSFLHGLVLIEQFVAAVMVTYVLIRFVIYLKRPS